MNVAVMIKHVVDSTEVRFDKKTGELRLRGLPEKISDYDKHAIEAGLQLKERYGAKVKAFTFGSKESFKSLKEAVAMGVDEGILITEPGSNAVYDQVIIAKILARAIAHTGGCDLVLCGAMSEDTTNKITGSALAAFLNMPYLPNVFEYQTDNGHDWVISSEIDGYEVKMEARPPLVLSVSRKLNEPKLATKIQIMKVPMKKILTYSLSDIGLGGLVEGVRCTFGGFTPITKQRKKIIFEESAAISVEKLIEKLKEEAVL